MAGEYNFSHLKVVTLWAGCITLFQSLVWIGLTITGIASFECAISYNSNLVTDKSVILFTFYDMYFKNGCTDIGYPTNPDYTNGISHITDLVVLNPSQIFIWVCVYLGVSVIWCLVSVLLVTFVRSDQLRGSSIVILVWVFVTLCICVMDLALGIIFGIDYNKISGYADQQEYGINSVMAIFIGAQVVSISMMIMAFKGFILWITNFGFIIYLCKEVFYINQALKSGNTSYFNRSYDKTESSESLDSRIDRAPISAYNNNNNMKSIQETPSQPLNNTAFVNVAYEVDSDDRTEIVNLQAIERASRMSTDNLQERRLRNLDSYAQYPPPEENRNSNQPHPVPDYTPPMPRSNRVNGQNSRY